MLNDTRRNRWFAALLSGALLTGAWLLDPSAARAEDSAFKGLIPGSVIAEGELGGIHGKGTTTSTSSSTTMGGSFLNSDVVFSLARAKMLARSARMIGADTSAKNAARASLGGLTFPRFSLQAEFDFSVVVESP